MNQWISSTPPPNATVARTGKALLIREAITEQERQRIFRFRYAIYVEEMGKPMPGADHEQRLLQDELDARSTQLYVERTDEIAGAVRITWGRDGLPPAYVGWYGLDRFRVFPPAAISFTGRMMVAGKHRNGPLAASLAREAYRRGLEHGVAFDFIHTTPPLIPLFERLGHRRYHGDFIDPDLGPRTPMVLVLEDLEHLEKTKSPFISTAAQWQKRPAPAEWFHREFPKGQAR